MSSITRSFSSLKNTSGGQKLTDLRKEAQVWVGEVGLVASTTPYTTVTDALCLV